VRWVAIPLTLAAAMFVFLVLAILTDSVPVIVRRPVRAFVPPPVSTKKPEVPVPPEMTPVPPPPPVLNFPLPGK
jgi:hypothetical protein